MTSLKRIESVKNDRVKQWKKLHTKKGRERQKAFLVEGFHLIEEALKEENIVMEMIVEELVSMPASWKIENIPVYRVTKSVMREISETEHPQGIVAVCKTPNHDRFAFAEGKYLLIDSVQDPGNVGTMIRTADSAGFHAVVLGKGSVDPFNGKVVRATQGSLFHLPVIQRELKAVIQELNRHGVPVFGTVPTGGKHYREHEKRTSFAVLVGNEGEGISEQLLDLCDEKVSIPIYGKAESLNVAVAAGIFMYELRANCDVKDTASHKS